MKDNYEISEIQRFTVNQFKADFNSLIERVGQGEVFIIEGEEGNALIVPYRDEYEDVEQDEIVGIHTEHNDGP